MAEVRFVRYLNEDLDREIGGLRLSAGLALEVVGEVPFACRTGRYRDVLWEPGALLCEVVGRPELGQVVLFPEMLSEECPEEALIEGMGRPGHVYEWEAR